MDWEGTCICRETVLANKRMVIGNNECFIPTDIREWVASPDSQEIRNAIDSMKLPASKEAGSFDERARAIWNFVCTTITYSDDHKKQNLADFWQFPAETLALEVGDCEDCSFLLISLLNASGVSPFCTRIVIGTIRDSDGAQVGHVWPVYKDEGGEWRILESTLPEATDNWPAADDMIGKSSKIRYFPSYCFNKYHLWTMSRRTRKSVTDYLPVTQNRYPLVKKLHDSFKEMSL